MKSEARFMICDDCKITLQVDIFKEGELLVANDSNSGQALKLIKKNQLQLHTKSN